MNTRALKKHLRYIVPELKLALIKEPGKKPVSVSCPEDIEKFIEPMRLYSEEHFVAFHLDAKNNVTGFQLVSHGTISASLVHPREVFKAAIISNSHSLIVAHNHPAGSIDPSREDLETTETLIEAGKLLGVPLLDHVIVTASDLRSLRESHGYLWT